ncbi:MAG TPA: response regulator [Leptolyngbyaceae cyanobacterium]
MSARILVVDDVPDNLFLLRFILEMEGYQVEIAENGRLALSKVLADPPALIMLDVMMPDITGCEVAKQIRQNPTLPPIPIVLVTAQRGISLTEAIAAGANDLIYKPVDIDEVIGKVGLFLHGHQESES